MLRERQKTISITSFLVFRKSFAIFDQFIGNGSRLYTYICLKEDLVFFIFCFIVGRTHRRALRNLRNIHTCISFSILHRLKK